MKTKVFALSILTAAAAILIIAAVFCYIPFKTAYAADGGLRFLISTSDGESWELFLGEESIATASGAFFDYGNSNAVSVKFESAIKRKLEEQGHTDYALSFALPNIFAEAAGDTEADYSETSGGILIKARYESVISSDIYKTLQYRTEGEFETYPFSAEQDGGLTFGQAIDAGGYRVRFALYEVFVFDGVRYSVPRYSGEIGCTVLAAEPEIPELGIVKVEYGTAAEDIAQALYDYSGEWTLSAEQNLPELAADRRARLEVKDGGYLLAFDYAPRNKNYKTAYGIIVNVEITPRILRVYISDDFSLVGEPVKTDFKYEISTPLAEGETEESLGIELYVENIDINAPGKYVIKARFENDNYLPQCLNYDNVFLEGGRYTIYATRLSAAAHDGSQFEVYIQSGIRNLTLRIDEYVGGAAIDGYVLVAGYEFIFENEDGERAFPETEYVVIVKRLNVSATLCAAIYGEGQIGNLSETVYGAVEVRSDMRALAFFTEDAASFGKSAYETTAYVLAGLCAALAVSLAALTVAYLKGGRYFK